MKKCPWCGEEYPDELLNCAIDQYPLESRDPVPVPPVLKADESELQKLEGDQARVRAIFTHRDSAIVGLMKSVLEEAGIECFIRNEHTSATFGAGALGLVNRLSLSLLCAL